MPGKETIANILAVIFTLSGLMDLGHGLANAPLPQSKNNEKEIHVFLSSNSLPAEGQFNRSRSENEFKEEVEESEELFFSQDHPSTYLVQKSSARIVGQKNLPWSYRGHSCPIFILHRQILT